MFKSQKTIDSFFKSTNPQAKELDVKRYFYLDWPTKFNPAKNAYWTNERPTNVNFIEQVNCNYIRKGHYFYICGNIVNYEAGAFKIGSEKTYKNTAYLKSHLQKSVRKENANLAVQTAMHMMRLDINEFIRRLSIIMLEDAYLHESFTTIVWLMIANANKKFKFQEYMYEWLLGVVYVITMIDKRDEFNVIPDEELLVNNKVIENLSSYASLENDEMSILYAIHMRIAYGGMDGDMMMLRKFIILWKRRFELKENLMLRTEVKPILLRIPELKIDNWDISAIDFHCCSNFLQYIAKKYDDLTLEEIKKIVWYHSSSINKRVPNIEYNPVKWREIKDYVIKTQKYLLSSNY